jgi:hypothetical protein
VGSNTSTITLRVAEGDEKGSLESETVKYGHRAIVNDRPVLLSDRAPHINKPATDSNKYLVVSPRRVLYSTQTGQLTVGLNIKTRIQGRAISQTESSQTYLQISVSRTGVVSKRHS